MHPNPKFHMRDRDAMTAMLRDIGFGTLVAQTPAGLRAVSVPVHLEGETLLFHLSRANELHAALTGGCDALFLVQGPHAYVSPDWYGLPDRVPTWNYVSLELSGRVEPLGRDELVRMLDTSSDEHEAQLAPKPVWTRAKMTPGKFDTMVGAITGFALHVTNWRGTAKIDQDKPPHVRARLAVALTERGDTGMADLMSSPAFAGKGDHEQHIGGALSAALKSPSTALRAVPLPQKTGGGTT